MEKVRWSEDGRDMWFEGQRIEVMSYLNFTETVLSRLESAYNSLQFQDKDAKLPEVNFYGVQDNSGNRSVNFYFANLEVDSVNTARKRMVQWLMQSGESRKWLGRKPDGKPFYHQAEIVKYEKKVQEFLEYLWFAVNLTCGVTGRGRRSCLFVGRIHLHQTEEF